MPLPVAFESVASLMPRRAAACAMHLFVHGMTVHAFFVRMVLLHHLAVFHHLHARLHARLWRFWRGRL